MLKAVNHTGPWTEPLDLDLHVTPDGEPRIPFSLFVGQKRVGATPAWRSSCQSTFPRFLELPTELQACVIRFCDAPTLFQLMRTSSAVRSEAKSLFWSCEDTWYVVEGSWLLAGGFPGRAHEDLDFLALAAVRVEVHFEFAQVRHPDRSQYAERAGDVEEGMQAFWDTLRRRLPRATHVILSPEAKGGSALPSDIMTIAQGCPQGITAWASIPEDEAVRGEDEAFFTYQRRRRLWQWARTESGPGRWTTVNPWTRTIVLPPPKRFRGPVGRYESVLRSLESYFMRSSAGRYLRVEAIERHHFDGRCEPFICARFVSVCRARFERAGDWTVHALGTGHDRAADPPEEFQKLFQQHSGELRSVWERGVHMPLQEMRQAWGNKGSEERQRSKSALLDQWEHDPLYALGKPAQETGEWRDYQILMDGELGREE